MSYLGYRLTPEGILPGSDKLKAVRDSEPPKTVHQVRQFMGLCNFFRSHVRNFAQTGAPLHKLTQVTHIVCSKLTLFEIHFEVGIPQSGKQGCQLCSVLLVCL